MPLPSMSATIERRLLINYRVDPEVLARVVPAPFRPQLVRDAGVAGICLVRLGQLRPIGFPRRLGVTTESAAHRIAVEWDSPDRPEGVSRGVYIPRRDTSSRLTALVGGRLFPGDHHLARFVVDERQDHLAVSFESIDGGANVAVHAQVTDEIPTGSIFASVTEASAFFENSPLGYSANRQRDRYHGVELACAGWKVEPVEVADVRSSWFEDPSRFPPGSAELESGLLMRDIPAMWKAHGSVADTAVAPRTGQPMVARSSP